MSDHHCLYQHVWLIKSWCDPCAFDWLAFRLENKATSAVKARGAYEQVVEGWCDEPLQLEAEPHQVVQLALPLGGWSVEQVSEPSDN